MRIRALLIAAACCAALLAQQRGGFVPGQQRKPEDPQQVQRGKTLYDVSCKACHGADLRGGDMGGPNLLRSQVAIVDKEGEQIVPIIKGSRATSGMPAIPMSDADAHAVAAYVRSVLGTIGVQGKPPGDSSDLPSILVGNAKAGQAYFDSHCASCHSVTGDLKGIATRLSDPRMLQNTWVAGGGGRRGGRGAAAAAPDPRRTVTAVVTPTGGQPMEGQLLRIDHFLVTLRLADGTVRSFTRDGDVPKVEVHDPMKPHRDLLAKYTDKDIHDVTAYLVTLK